MKTKNDVIKRWIQKAENDLKTAAILINAKEAPTESVCFHAQQAVEKFLKAYLTHIDLKAGKTYDIATLLEMCIDNDKEFESLNIEELEGLTFYAVEVRYPDDFYIPSLKEAQNALALSKEVKSFVLKKLRREIGNHSKTDFDKY
jgi:HEPN domain-containing protein